MVTSTRYLNATAILTAVALLALPAAAGARTHRFSAATDVTVGFKLPKRDASSTLVRFTRNHVALIRSRGSLVLQANGKRSRSLALPAGRAPRVLVELSAAKGTARLTLGRKTATIVGRFVAEDAVAVPNNRLVVRLRTRSAASSATPQRTESTATLSAASAPAAGTDATATDPVPPPPAPAGSDLRFHQRLERAAGGRRPARS